MYEKENEKSIGKNSREEFRLIEVKEDILADNKSEAQNLRNRLKQAGTYLLNLMSSPGSGKTSLILQLVENLQGDLKTGVIEADIDSSVDTERLTGAGIKALQLRTGGLCHIDAVMAARGLEALEAELLDLAIIENIGNLVCPAEFDTGAFKNAVILSVTEGDDKPRKYPLVFSICDLVLINKTDLLDYTDFELPRFKENLFKVNPGVECFEVSARTGQGIQEWSSWIKKEVWDFQQGKAQ